ncbi:MAG: transglutaminase domain-containing protein [Nitrospirota bacterium]|nr:MAG: transglutaminase domain-containing protein [Nitrospirota bacterium]
MDRLKIVMTLMIILFVAVLPAHGASAKKKTSISVVHETLLTKGNEDIKGLVLRLPLPSNHKSRAYSQKVTSISVKIDPEPSGMEDISDRAGNSFKKIHWRSVSGPARVELSFSASINERPVILKSKAPYPVRVSKRFEAYLTPTAGEKKIGKKLEEIISEATQGKRTEMDAVRSILDWVHRNIDYKASSPGTGASYSLSKGYGNSGGYPNLLVSLLKRSGIPARVVFGLKIMGQSRSHIWAEVYFPDIGWVPYDPSTKQLAFTSKLIKFTEGPSSGPIIKSWRTSGSKPEYSERTDVN